MKRIEIAKGAFNSILKKKNCSTHKYEKKFMQAYVWSTLLYGCETWTIATRNMTKLHSFEMWAYLKITKISWREKKTNEEVLTLADEQLYIIPTIKKRKITYLNRRNYIHRLLLEGPLEGKEAEEGRERSSLKYSIQIVGLQRKAKNGVDDKHHSMDGDAIRIPRETCSRSGAMEDHDSQPSQRRRHLMMMI